MKSLSAVKAFPALLTAMLAVTLNAGAQTPGDGGLSRIFVHRDGSRTESVKMGNSRDLKEFHYNVNKLLVSCRHFVTDSNGRIRKGIIFDGRTNPLGTVMYNFDKVTGKTIEERTFNTKGQLIMRLMYPGTLADPRLASRYVAFHYNPNDPNAKPVQDTRRAKPVRPVEENQESYGDDLPPALIEKPSAIKPAKPETLNPAKPVAAKPTKPEPAKPETPKPETLKPSKRSFLPQKPTS